MAACGITLRRISFIGTIAVIGMAATAIIEAGLVALLQPLTDEALVAKNLETAKWIPFAFTGIFVLRGISGFATEASLGWIGRRVISDLRREVFSKFPHAADPIFRQPVGRPAIVPNDLQRRDGGRVGDQRGYDCGP